MALKENLETNPLILSLMKSLDNATDDLGIQVPVVDYTNALLETLTNLRPYLRSREFDRLDAVVLEWCGVDSFVNLDFEAALKSTLVLSQKTNEYGVDGVGISLMTIGFGTQDSRGIPVSLSPVTQLFESNFRINYGEPSSPEAFINPNSHIIIARTFQPLS